MTAYVVVHVRPSDAQHEAINSLGWDSDVGKAYLAATTPVDKKADYELAKEFNMLCPVAKVEAESLEDAYCLTQHIEENWTKNEGVLALVSDPRSSMVGDLIVNLETRETHRVSSFGFTEYNPA